MPAATGLPCWPLSPLALLCGDWGLSERVVADSTKLPLSPEWLLRALPSPDLLVVTLTSALTLRLPLPLRPRRRLPPPLLLLLEPLEPLEALAVLMLLALRRLRRPPMVDGRLRRLRRVGALLPASDMLL